MPGGSSDDDEKVGGSSGDEGKAYADQGLGGGEFRREDWCCLFHLPVCQPRTICRSDMNACLAETDFNHTCMPGSISVPGAVDRHTCRHCEIVRIKLPLCVTQLAALTWAMGTRGG